MDVPTRSAEQVVLFSEPGGPVAVEGRVAKVCNQELLGNGF